MSNRPGSRSGGPPGTALGRPSARPGSRAGGFNTGFRPPGTALPPGTRSGRQGGVSFHPNPDLSNRPMTQQGMKGAVRIQTSAGVRAGGQDKNSVVGALRAKLTALEEEVENLTKELETFNTESERYVAYEKRADDLNKDLEELQGTLADYNMLVDKFHTDTDIDDIHRQIKKLRKKNDVEGKRIDAIFAERTSKDNEIAAREAEIEELRVKAEAELKSLAPEALQQYQQADNENKQYTAKIQQQQQQLDVLTSKIAAMEEELQADPTKQRALKGYERRAELLAKKNELLMEEKAAKVSGPEEKERLLQLMKESNQEIGVMMRHIESLQAGVQRQQEALASLEKEAQERQGDRYEKFVQVYEKDQQMQKYIEAFPAEKEKQLAQITETEEIIAMLLEHISQGLDRKENLPSQDQVRNMEGNLEFQNTQAQNAKRTLESLQKERIDRQTDLKKLAVMDKKINNELEDLKTRIPRMEEELKVFSDLEKLKKDGKELEAKLTKQRDQSKKRKEVLKFQVQAETAKVEKLKKELDSNEIHQVLKGLEANLSVYSQANMQLREYIEVRGSESDYKGKLENCNVLLDEVNKLVMELTKHPAPL